MSRQEVRASNSATSPLVELGPSPPTSGDLSKDSKFPAAQLRQAIAHQDAALANDRYAHMAVYIGARMFVFNVVFYTHTHTHTHYIYIYIYTHAHTHTLCTDSNMIPTYFSQIHVRRYFLFSKLSASRERQTKNAAKQTKDERQKRRSYAFRSLPFVFRLLRTKGTEQCAHRRLNRLTERDSAREK